MNSVLRRCTAGPRACAAALLVVGCGDRADDGPRPADLWLLDMDGAPVRALTTHAAADEEPEFSRDGRLVLFDSDRGGSNDLFTLEPSTGAVQRLTEGPEKVDHGAWSPDGRWIAYQHDAGDNTDVWVMRADGSERTRLTTHAARDGWPDWSPAGDRIVFSSERTGRRELYLMQPDGSEVRQLTGLESGGAEGAESPPGDDGADSEAGSTDPAWAPDSGWIAFNSTRDGNSELYRIRPDGTDETRLTDTPAVQESRPAWSPDGRTLYFTRAEAGWLGIGRLTLPGGPSEQWSVEPGFVRPNVAPTGDSVVAERRR